jgi:RHS repeat-associated protein
VLSDRLLTDHLGSPRLVINTSDGSVAQRMEYDEFGRVLTDTNPGFQPFGFAGGLYDRDTGLVRFGRRDYDPATGRWTAKDHLGVLGGDPNIYAYVDNDPLNYFDAFGESKTKGIQDAADPYLARLRAAMGDREAIRAIEKEARALWEIRDISPERWRKIRAWVKLAKDGRLGIALFCFSTVECHCMNDPAECAELFKDPNESCDQ